jgi:ubiquinone/menaquinone biosynthesis C-methylase UbiE
VTTVMMQAEQAARYPSPFDAIAERYDDTFSSSIIGQLQRGAVWDEVSKHFHPGDRILDLGCGTGIDAHFLAEQGMHVIACDKSAQMLRVADRRIGSLSRTSGSAQLRLLPAEEISSLNSSAPFDGALSNFGAVNCVGDIAKLARDLAILLKQRSSLLLCVIGPVCAWETVWYLLHAKPGKAFRRFNRRSVPARLEGGDAFNVYYRSVRPLQSVFAPHFRLKSIRGIGVTVPPTYVEAWARRFPGIVRLGAIADRYLGSCPGVRGLADHLLLRFERTGTD